MFLQAKISLLLLFPALINAQNLVPNAGFEDNKGGYITIARDEIANRRKFEATMADWTSVTCNSPDVRNIKKLQKGERIELPPHSGSSFAGVVCSAANAELISAKLTRPILAGERVYAECWYAFAPLQFIKPPTNNNDSMFAMLFTEKALRVDNSYAPRVGESIDFARDLVIPKLKWTKLSRTFTAKNTLNYINIGFFLPENSFGGIQGSYYYIDDVLVVPAAEHHEDTTVALPPKVVVLPKKMPIENLNTAKKGATIILENIEFETAKAVILPQSFAELEKIVVILEKNTNLRIEIQGHTDNTGKAENNQILSENRARAVLDFLLKKGIKASQISAKGYGDTVPLVPNTTPESRSKNRRVAFKVL
jgi:outer membrane protein OmpA-like peptidoglycan-associated protein